MLWVCLSRFQGVAATGPKLCPEPLLATRSQFQTFSSVHVHTSRHHHSRPRRQEPSRVRSYLYSIFDTNGLWVFFPEFTSPKISAAFLYFSFLAHTWMYKLFSKVCVCVCYYFRPSHWLWQVYSSIMPRCCQAIATGQIFWCQVFSECDKSPAFFWRGNFRQRVHTSKAFNK